MSKIAPGELWLTQLDHGRLFKLNGGHPPEPLTDVLDSAELIESTHVRADVVTLYSQVLVTQDDGEQHKLTLCYPDDAEPHAGFISVLSPVGAGLLGDGLHHGDVACWPAGTPTGHRIDNRSDAPLRYLVIGTRRVTDTIHYPDHDLITHKDGPHRRYTHADGRPRSKGDAK
mgnify:CR=1 FL=1